MRVVCSAVVRLVARWMVARRQGLFPYKADAYFEPGGYSEWALAAGGPGGSRLYPNTAMLTRSSRTGCGDCGPWSYHQRVRCEHQTSPSPYRYRGRPRRPPGCWAEAYPFVNHLAYFSGFLCALLLQGGVLRVIVPSSICCRVAIVARAPARVRRRMSERPHVQRSVLCLNKRMARRVPRCEKVHA
jgi:hypothetical protein